MSTANEPTLGDLIEGLGLSLQRHAELDPERMRLAKIRREYVEHGNRLLRMERECREQAHECFESAKRVAEQMEVLK